MKIFSDNVRYITLTQYMVMLMVRVIYYMHIIIMNNELRHQQTAVGPFMSLHNFDICDKWEVTTYINFRFRWWYSFFYIQQGRWLNATAQRYDYFN